MRERLLDRDHNGGRRLLAFNGETAPQQRIDAHSGSAVDAIGLVRPGNEKDQRDPQVLEDVLQTVQPIIASAIGDQQDAPFRRDIGLVSMAEVAAFPGMMAGYFPGPDAARLR